jgi:effector-binding domain-containing protein
MLRHYDEIGLLMPEHTDIFSNYRYYSASQLPIAERINDLKQMGFSLATIGQILKKYDDPTALAEFLAVKQSEIQAEAEMLNRRLLFLDTALKRLRKDETAMKYNVTLKTMPERYVASVRMIIPAYDQEYILWNTLSSETAALSLQPEERSFGLAVFHDESYKESDVDVEIQIAIKGSYENTEHVVFKRVPAIEIASATYKGSYDQITAVNQAVAKWVEDNGYEFNGPMFCIYHVSPGQTDNFDELVTEVCYPVRK